MGAGDDEELKTDGRTLHAASNLYVRTLANIGSDPYELLCSISGRHFEGVNQQTLLTIDGKWLVSVLHYLLCVTGG